MSGDRVEPSKEDGGTFSCQICNLKETYSYFGRKPKFLKSIIFLEDCYIIPSPFNEAGSDKFIVLGGECTKCFRTVCSGCSLFYSKRFCNDCAIVYKSEFPQEVQCKIK